MSMRLQSAPLFERAEEQHQISPKRVVVLSVEGNVTEKDYFELVQKYRDSLGIQALVYIEVLPEEMQAALGQWQFDSGFLKQYYDHPETIDEPGKSEFEQKMRLAGIDITYRRHLRSCQGRDGNDVFGIVIDRDAHNTSEQMSARFTSNVCG